MTAATAYAIAPARAAARAAAEIRLIAAIAPIGRWGLALADRAGIRAEHLAEDDARAIWHALTAADQCGVVDRANIAALIRLALIDADRWRDDDRRRWCTGSTWGPEAVAALLAGMDRFVAEEAIPARAAELLAAVAAQENA
jgi:hypothetical protein